MTTTLDDIAKLIEDLRRDNALSHEIAIAKIGALERVHKTLANEVHAATDLIGKTRVVADRAESVALEAKRGRQESKHEFDSTVTGIESHLSTAIAPLRANDERQNVQLATITQALAERAQEGRAAEARRIEAAKERDKRHERTLAAGVAALGLLIPLLSKLVDVLFGGH
jgi:hypothetical protein